MNNQQPSSFFDEGIKLISFCPICQTREKKMEAKVIEENEAAHLVHLHCIGCGSSVLAVLTMSPNGLNSMGMLTDLSAEDTFKFKEIVSLSADDVLALHELNGRPEWFTQFINE